MKMYQTKSKCIDVIKSVKCDCCHGDISVRNPIEFQEIVSIDFVGGCGSVFGDGTRVQLELCQYCFKRLMDGMYRISDE